MFITECACGITHVTFPSSISICIYTLILTCLKNKIILFRPLQRNTLFVVTHSYALRACVIINDTWDKGQGVKVKELGSLVILSMRFNTQSADRWQMGQMCSIFDWRCGWISLYILRDRLTLSARTRSGYWKHGLWNGLIQFIISRLSVFLDLNVQPYCRWKRPTWQSTAHVQGASQRHYRMTLSLSKWQRSETLPGMIHKGRHSQPLHCS